MRLPRPCAKCGKRFQPFGKANKICDECSDLAKKMNKRNTKGDTLQPQKQTQMVEAKENE